MQTRSGWKRLLLFNGQIQVCLITFLFGNSLPHAPVVWQELLLANGQRRVHVPPCAMSGDTLVDFVNQLVDEPAACCHTQQEGSLGGLMTLLSLSYAIIFIEV